MRADAVIATAYLEYAQGEQSWYFDHVIDAYSWFGCICFALDLSMRYLVGDEYEARQQPAWSLSRRTHHHAG
jgi:hypothetical protein